MNGIEQRLDVLVSKLRRAAGGRNVRPFGAEAHGFRSLPALRDRQVSAFETRHQVTLPDEYRAFLMRVSSGGAGPAYGMIPFDEALPEAFASIPNFLATPFPFETAYWQPRDLGDDELHLLHLRERVGTLNICHEGCGHFHFLVCSGPSRGQVWIDSTVSDGPYHPLGIGFLDWFERWLDDALVGGRGTWWLRGAFDDDHELQEAMRKVVPWWRKPRS